MMTLRMLVLGFVLMVSFIYGCEYNCGGDLRYIWYGDGIVPFVISYIPTTVVYVTFTGGAVAETGKYLTLDQIASEPQSISCSFNASNLYAIAMFDPDSPSEQSPTDAQYLQWFVVNVPGQSATDSNLNAGDVLEPYETPLPATNTGTHSYVVLVFDQGSKKLDVQPPNQRQHFDIESYANQNGLGQAVCGDFFFVRTDN